MCGILTYFANDKIGPNHQSIASISHRGPDGFGVQSFRLYSHFLTLGHRRLSIIDLSENASQPMQFHDSGLWITYNGEIYNYVELKAELRQFGYKFKTRSDTEVVLAAYDKWGTQCLGKFNGMFAFTIFDERTKVLFAARDRYGVKPLYYWNSPHGLAVVSEIKQLISLAGFESSVNMDTLFQFLQYGDFGYNEQTLWKGVLELEPGMMFCVNLDNWKFGDTITPVRWYDCSCYFDAVPIGESEAIEQFRFLLKDAIKLRLRSDVPLGVTLSGGLDSSSITCMLDNDFKGIKPLRTFSACYNEQEFDERRYINTVLESTSVESHKVFLTPSYVEETMDFATRIHDIPTTAMSILSHHYLYQYIKSAGTTVILDGHGADEILAGYRDFIWPLLINLLINLHPITCVGEYLSYVRNYKSNHYFEGKYLLRTLFPKAYAKKVAAKRQKIEPIFSFDTNGGPEAIRYDKSLSKMHQIRMGRLRPILHNIDRVSMGHSIEIRNPFLDYRLVEFCLKLPASLKIHKGMQKHLLRKSLVDILPAQICERKDKKGFSSPDSIWSKGPLAAFYRDGLSKLKDIPFVQHKEAMKRFDGFEKGEIPYDKLLWRLISFQRWLSVYKISI